MAISTSTYSKNNNANLDESNIIELIASLSSVVNLPAGITWEQVSQIEIFLQDTAHGSIMIQTNV